MTNGHRRWLEGDLIVPAAFDKDRLSMVSRDAIMTQSFKVLDAIQREPMELQAAAVFAVFAAYTSKLRIDPFLAFHMGQKMQRPDRYHRQANTQLEALDDFVGLRAAGVI